MPCYLTALQLQSCLISTSFNSIHITVSLIYSLFWLYVINPNSHHPPLPCAPVWDAKGKCLTWQMEKLRKLRYQVTAKGSNYSVIKKGGLDFVRLYFLNYTWCVNDLHNIRQEEVLNVQIPPLERSPSSQPCSSVSWGQNGYYSAQCCIVAILG
jgi:hypothetical protein